MSRLGCRGNTSDFIQYIQSVSKVFISPYFPYHFLKKFLMFFLKNQQFFHQSESSGCSLCKYQHRRPYALLFLCSVPATQRAWHITAGCVPLQHIFACHLGFCCDESNSRNLFPDASPKKNGNVCVKIFGIDWKCSYCVMYYLNGCMHVCTSARVQHMHMHAMDHPPIHPATIHPTPHMPPGATVRTVIWPPNSWFESFRDGGSRAATPTARSPPHDPPRPAAAPLAPSTSILPSPWPIPSSSLTTGGDSCGEQCWHCKRQFPIVLKAAAPPAFGLLGKKGLTSSGGREEGSPRCHPAITRYLSRGPRRRSCPNRLHILNT